MSWPPQIRLQMMPSGHVLLLSYYFPRVYFWKQAYQVYFFALAILYSVWDVCWGHSPLLCNSCPRHPPWGHSAKALLNWASWILSPRNLQIGFKDNVLELIFLNWRKANFGQWGVCLVKYMWKRKESQFCKEKKEWAKMGREILRQGSVEPEGGREAGNSGFCWHDPDRLRASFYRLGPRYLPSAYYVQ